MGDYNVFDQVSSEVKMDDEKIDFVLVYEKTGEGWSNCEF